MQTITIASGKGGVGKTVIAASLARILSKKYYAFEDISRSIRVIVLDLDLHTRGLTYLMYPNLETLRALPVSMEDILLEVEVESREMNFKDFRVFTEYPSPVVVPASLQMGMPFLPSALSQN